MNPIDAALTEALETVCTDGIRIARGRYASLPEVEVDTFRAAMLWAWHRRRVHLLCATAEIAEKCERLLADRLGKRAAKELVRVSVRVRVRGAP